MWFYHDILITISLAGNLELTFIKYHDKKIEDKNDREIQCYKLNNNLIL